MLPRINSLARKAYAIPRVHWSGPRPGRLWQNCYSSAVLPPTHDMVPETAEKPEAVAPVQRGEHHSGRDAAGRAVAQRRVERAPQHGGGVRSDDPQEGEPRARDPGARGGRQRRGEEDKAGKGLRPSHPPAALPG